MKTKKLLLILLSGMTLFSLNAYSKNCPDSFEGIKRLSKKKRLECTLYKIGILERYLDEEEGYEWEKGHDDIATVAKKFRSLEDKTKGRYENYCFESFQKNQAKLKSCLDSWRKSSR